MIGFIKIQQRRINIPVKVKDIIRFEGGKGNSSSLFLANGKSYKVTGNVGEWIKRKEIVASRLFVLVHRSHLVNCMHVVSYGKTDGVTMSDKSNVPIITDRFKKLEKRIFSDAVPISNLSAMLADIGISVQ